MTDSTLLPVALEWAAHDVINENARWWLAWSFDPQFLLPLALLAFWLIRPRELAGDRGNRE